MKRILFIICTIVVVSVMVSACATQHKCPAYGHYTELPQPVEHQVAEL